METGYKKFDLCLQLKELGFPQKRTFQSMYYVRPDMLICVDDLSALKSDGHTDFENIFNTLVFRPRTQDLLEVCGDVLREFIRVGDGTIMAYSVVEEDPEYLKETGRTDPYIRANGADWWEALVNLFIAVKQHGRKVPFTPADADASENQHEADINPNLP